MNENLYIHEYLWKHRDLALKETLSNSDTCSWIAPKPRWALKRSAFPFFQRNLSSSGEARCLPCC